MKRTISMLTALVMLFTTTAFATTPSEVQDENIAVYSIAEPYCYEVIIDSAEWKDMSLHDRVEQFSLPEGITEQMTTEALARTVMENPFILDILAFDNFELGYHMTCGKVDGLEELISRADLDDALEEILARPGETLLREGDTAEDQASRIARRVKLIRRMSNQCKCSCELLGT